MQEIQQQSTLDKWEKLAQVFESATEEKMDAVAKKLGVDEVCIVGLAKSLNLANHEKGSTMGKVTNMLLHFGFTMDEIRRTTRICPVSGCGFNSKTMFDSINHMIGWHQIPHKNLGNMMRVMKDDTRKVDTTFINQVKRLPMGAD
jgi:hypothetical protein